MMSKRVKNSVLKGKNMADYNQAIALAAKEYVAAYLKANLYLTEKNRKDREYAYGKLHWMIDAERYGWDPETFTSECLL